MISQRSGPLRSKNIKMFERSIGFGFLRGSITITKPNVGFIKGLAVYASLLYLSWTPDTLRLMCASKYWLHELPGRAKMFSSEMTLDSAWIHLLTVDLFAARQVYGDGLQNNIVTQHSVSLCLLSRPIGNLAHALTKALTKERKEKNVDVITDEDAISSDLIK